MRKAEMELERAPEFEARDTHGRLVRLSDFRGGALVLTFLRGFA